VDNCHKKQKPFTAKNKSKIPQKAKISLANFGLIRNFAAVN
jgi:hypothetical protein